MAGLTDAGLEIETLETLVISVSADYVERTGVAPDAVAEQAPDGILIRSVMRPVAECWEALEQVYNAMDSDSATGTSLVQLSLLTGTLIEAARSSIVTLVLAGDLGTVVSEGSQASSPSTGTVWATTAASDSFGAADAWTNTTLYALYDIVTNNGNVYRAIEPGTSAGSGGPTTESADITDGTVHWAFIGTGDSYATAPAAALLTGPKTGLAGTITVIETPINGWSGVANMLDADLGADLETDADLRVRRAAEIQAQGAGIPEAIRGELLRVPLVTAATVFYNPSDETDGDGIPPHSVECLVEGGADQDIWDQLWLSVGGGIYTQGAEVGTVIDSQGTSQTMRFTRPEEVPIYMIITVEVDAAVFASGGAGEVLVENAAVNYADALPAGRDARARPIGSSVISRLSDTGAELGVPGVVDCTSVKIGIAPAPTLETTIAISLRQRARYDTSRTSVVVVEVVP